MSRSKNIFRWLIGINKENWKVIFFCLVTATTFWFFRSLNEEYTTRLNYPVYFQFNRDSLVEVSELPEEIRLDVTSGGWNLLRKAYAFNLQPISINLENPVTTKYLVGATLLGDVSDQLVELRLNYIVTDTLFLNIERLISKTLVVSFDSVHLLMSPNFQVVSSLDVQPDTLVMKGPSSRINSLSDTLLVKLPFTNIDQNFDAEVQIEMDSSPLLQVFPSDVRLKFQVEEIIRQSASLTLDPVNFPGNTKFRLADSTVSLFYRVRESLAQDVPDSLFRVTANFADLNLSDTTLIPRVMKYPEFISDLSLEPLQVKLVYEE